MDTTGTQMNERIKRSKQWYDVREFVSMDQFDEAVGLFNRMHQENAPHIPFSVGVLRKRIARYLDDIERNWSIGWIAYKDGTPIGFLAGIAELNYFSEEVVTRTQFWFVDKDYRGTPVAMLLLREFVKWSALRGSIRMQIDTIMQKNLPAFTKLATKLGFNPAGAYFIKDHYNA